MNDLATKAQTIWTSLTEQDYLEAFKGHPMIGDLASLAKKFETTSSWAGEEQSSTKEASPEILESLSEANHTYLERFGFIFIICATGKSASEMLDSIEKRLKNSREIEIQNAADEQMKITLLRLEKLVMDKN